MGYFDVFFGRFFQDFPMISHKSAWKKFGIFFMKIPPNRVE